MYAPLLKQIVIMILNFIYFHTNMNYYIIGNCETQICNMRAVIHNQWR